MSLPFEAEVTQRWAESLERALGHLWSLHDRKDFYYFVLATTDALDFPFASAWSEQSLLLQAARLGHSPAEIRFSCGDSPFVDFAAPFTAALRPQWDADVDRGRTSDDATREALTVRRLGWLVDAMRRLRISGVVEETVIINVEIGESDRERARMLNPPSELLEEYLKIW